MTTAKSSQVTHEEVAYIGEIGHERLDSHIRDEQKDPHRAALEDIDPNQKVSKSTWAAVFFLGFTFQSSLIFTILLIFPNPEPISIELQGSTTDVNWMASGWSLAGSIAFAIAGQPSDHFRRRYVLSFGQALLVLGYIIGTTAHSVNQGTAAMVSKFEWSVKALERLTFNKIILGFGTVTTFVLYPGTRELLPNKYRPVDLAYGTQSFAPLGHSSPEFYWPISHGDVSSTSASSQASSPSLARPSFTSFQQSPSHTVLECKFRESSITLESHYTSGLTLCWFGLG